MHKLLRLNRLRHALEISKWMDSKSYLKLSSCDVAFRLFLISKATGIDEAENYFNNLPQKLKCGPVYGALLNCYATAQHVEKAEAVMQQIRNSGGNHPRNYAVMLSLYRKTGNKEKFDALLQEMEEKGIERSRDSLETQLSAYSDVKDFERMDKIVTLLECDPNVAPTWKTYSVAAAAYTKAGLFDKALQLLRKAEARVSGTGTGKGYDAYDCLLTQYGTIGRKDDVLRLWSLYKQKRKVYYDGYKNGLMGKAEALLDKAMCRGKPNAWTWYYMSEGYLLNEQYEKAVEMMKKIASDSMRGRKPVPAVESIKACLEYLKGVGDTKQAEEFAKLLEERDVNSLDQQEERSVEEEGNKLL